MAKSKICISKNCEFQKNLRSITKQLQKKKNGCSIYCMVSSMAVQVLVLQDCVQCAPSSSTGCCADPQFCTCSCRPIGPASSVLRQYMHLHCHQPVCTRWLEAYLLPDMSVHGCTSTFFGKWVA